MTQGTQLTKGTRLYFALPNSSSEILRVACPTAIPELSAGEKPRFATTCLDSTGQEYRDGLPDPPALVIPVNFIPRSASHQALIAANALGSAQVMPWMVVMSDEDGTPGDPPVTLDSEGYLVSPQPTTIGFKAYVANFTFTASTSEIWRGNLTLQIQLLDGKTDLDYDLDDPIYD
jgi:hypothetical protein